MFSFSLVTPPALEPITLAEAKAYARIDTDADDALLATLITAARQWAEKYASRAFLTQTWQLAIDQLPVAAQKNSENGLDAPSVLRLPRAPLQSILSVQYFDDSGRSVVWPSTNYDVDTAREPGRLVVRSGCVWPSSSRLVNDVIVTYVAGYGDDAAAVPDPIKLAIRQLAVHWYEHRGDVDTSVGIPQVVLALLDPYRLRFASL